jgi:hypothetical protein
MTIIAYIQSASGQTGQTNLYIMRKVSVLEPTH